MQYCTVSRHYCPIVTETTLTAESPAPSTQLMLQYRKVFWGTFLKRHIFPQAQTVFIKSRPCSHAISQVWIHDAQIEKRKEEREEVKKERGKRGEREREKKGGGGGRKEGRKEGKQGVGVVKASFSWTLI